MFLATSDIHLQYKLRITRDQCVVQAREAMRFAKSLCDDVEFSPEDATRTDPEFLCRVLDAVVEAGRDHAEHSGHGRIHDAVGVRRFDRDHPAAREGH